MKLPLPSFACLVLLVIPILLPAQRVPLPDGYDERVLPREHHPVTQDLDLVDQTVEADIRNRLAQVTVTSIFENHTGRPVEGVYLFPIPARAGVNRFRMELDGKLLEGEVLDAARAREIYESFLRRRKDPGLLDLLGQDLLRTRVFPVRAGARAVIQVAYSHLLEEKPAVFRAPCFGRGKTPAGRSALRIRIEDGSPLKSIYSPTHPGLILERTDDRHAVASLELRSTPEWNGFVLYYDTSDGDLGASFLTYRDADQGFWALLVSPGLASGREAVLPRDFVFLLDRSGSMQGQKIEQARGALAACIARLSERDRFNVVSFATGVEDLGEGLLAADAGSKARAQEAVARIRAEGGTNLHDALEAAFRRMPLESGRLPCVFLLTDGLPTVGVTDPEAILRNARAWNAGRARLFCFGVGNDVNTYLLDALAQDHQGARDYVGPSEPVGDKVAALFGKLSAPVMRDIRVSVAGVSVSDLIPRTPGDLYLGDQLVLCGRYRGAGKATIVMEGRAEGGARRIEVPVEFPERDVRQESVAVLWARRRIGFLIDEIRLHGVKDQELLDEIVGLSRRYRIVTPYTAFLITEEGDVAALRERLEPKLAALKKAARRSGFEPAATAEAAKASVELQETKK